MKNLDKAKDWELHKMLTLIRCLKGSLETKEFELNFVELEAELVKELKERGFISPKGREFFPLAWDFGIYDKI
jgi:hypothetical protein